MLVTCKLNRSKPYRLERAADFLEPAGIGRKLHQRRILHFLPPVGIAVEDGGIVIDLGIDGKRKPRKRFQEGFQGLRLHVDRNGNQCAFGCPKAQDLPAQT